MANAMEQATWRFSTIQVTIGTTRSKTALPELWAAETGRRNPGQIFLLLS
jgi:hypothetical protein